MIQWVKVWESALPAQYNVEDRGGTKHSCLYDYDVALKHDANRDANIQKNFNEAIDTKSGSLPPLSFPFPVIDKSWSPYCFLPHFRKQTVLCYVLLPAVREGSWVIMAL